MPCWILEVQRQDLPKKCFEQTDNQKNRKKTKEKRKTEKQKNRKKKKEKQKKEKQKKEKQKKEQKKKGLSLFSFVFLLFFFCFSFVFFCLSFVFFLSFFYLFSLFFLDKMLLRDATTRCYYEMLLRVRVVIYHSNRERRIAVFSQESPVGVLLPLRILYKDKLERP